MVAIHNVVVTADDAALEQRPERARHRCSILAGDEVLGAGAGVVDFTD